MSLLGELIDQPAHRGLIAPLRIALERAFGRHLDPIDFGHPAEMLDQGAVGQADGKAAKVFQEQSACDITAQGAAGMDLNLALRFGREVLEWAVSLPVFETLGDELRFEPALQEQLIDTEKLLAQTLVVDIAYDGGQRRSEELLNRNKRSWHEARL